tara:strand:- start:38507 stop:39445 length:939 start_codon:yes stop_codon:yes gene_type:complete
MNEKQINDEMNFRDQEIDLKVLFSIIWHKKLFIGLVTVFFSISAVIYSLLLPNIYESEAILSPVDKGNGLGSVMRNYGSLASLAGINFPNQDNENLTLKALEKLKSLSFFKENIMPNIFLPNLIAVNSWDSETNTIYYDDSIYNKSTNTWTKNYSVENDKNPSPQESYKEFLENHFTISEDKKTGFVNLSVRHQSPLIAKKWTELTVTEINSFYREKDKSESQKAVEYLNNQISKTSLSEVKVVIAELLQKETQKLTLIEANQYYVFDYIDPPAVMEQRIKPRRSLISILGFALGILVGTFLVLVNNYGKKK